MEIEKKQSETGYNDPIFIEKMDAFNANGAEIENKFNQIVKDYTETKNKIIQDFIETKNKTVDKVKKSCD